MNIREAERRLIQKEMFRLEDQKVAAEQRFQAMFENALVGLFRGDFEKGTLIAANRETARIFGFDSSDDLMDWVNNRENPFSYLQVITRLDKPVEGETRTFSTRMQRVDGSEFWAQFSIRFLEGCRYAEGAVKDITEQVESIEKLRHAKSEAEEASEAKSRFLATMSHEIRTPLNGIVGYAEIIASGDGGEAKVHARKILDESDRLMLLLNQLLDISRLEAEKMQLETIPFDLHEVLDETEASVMATVVKKGLEYRRDLGIGVPRWFVGDPLRLGQVLTNLLSNAVKFTDSGGIVLRLRRKLGSGESVRIEFAVKDTGIGIPQEKQQTIFSSFEQADSSISRKYGGTGLGVSICRELVSLMGGKLLLDSRPGKGSTFRFTIPMTSAPEAPEGTPAKRLTDSEKSNLLKGVRVLIVEDYETNREIVRHHLENAGCLVEFANNGREAVDALVSGEPVQIVFMDMHMPVMDGLAATMELRARGFKAPVIGMTASAYEDDRVKCLAAGMDDFITKPLRRAALLAKAVDWVVSNSIVEKASCPDKAGLNGLLGRRDSLTPAPALRYNDLLDELDGAEDLAFELVEGFAETAAVCLEKAAAALKAGRFGEVHREVHSVKGGALNLMADEVAIRAQEAEKAAKNAAENGESAGLEDLLRNLRTAFADFEAEWRRIRESDETEERQPGPL